ncbi:MAG: hypothetical protein HC876_11415 [Chloroflexaceae bacterium]|nr:hypothetical protein [Chloroflexaceae bacterium]NJO06072.1 hypothetical protein [Chloroflexaceae bacterium]
MHVSSPAYTPNVAIQSQPPLIFATELDGSALNTMLATYDLYTEFAQRGYGLALAIGDLSDVRAAVVQQLNAHQIYTVAWMMLPAIDGYGFNLRNYPQAIEHYRTFRAWAQQHGLHFAAIAMNMQPPADDLSRLQHLRLRDIGRWLAQASDNTLFLPGSTAYHSLIDEMHRDGYAVHTYQLPLMVDDRRAGTTSVQSALDVVDLPVDLEVLMCHSSLPIPIEGLNNDIGGALIVSYGASAESIGIGYTHAASQRSVSDAPGVLEARALSLSWDALERDMLLATRYTDTIYIFSLEGCVERGLMPHIANINWDGDVRVPVRQRLLVATLRSSLLVLLFLVRQHRLLFSWLGWIIALLLLVRQWRRQ